MSLVPANIEYLAFAFQADKATPATDPLIAISLEDCSLDPNRQEIRTAESDRSAQQGPRMIVGAEPGGSLKKYVRPSEEDFFLHGLLGRTVDTGDGSPGVHTSNVDPAAPFDSPYLTIWDVWPGRLAIRYDGVRIAQGKYDTTPGSALAVEYTLLGLNATYGVDEPDVEELFVDELPFSWANLAATVGEEHTGVVNNLSLTISRGTTRFSGDNGLGSLDVPNGLLDITGNLEVAFENDQLTRGANTGEVDGTDITDLIYESALSFDFTRGDDLEVKLALAAIQIGNLRTALKTDASPAVTTFDFNHKRTSPSAIADAIQSIVKNGFVTADRT